MAEQSPTEFKPPQDQPQTYDRPYHSRMYDLQTHALTALRGGPTADHPVSLLHQCIAEFFGTFFLCIFGIGAVCNATLTGAHVGLWQVAIVWGFALALSVYFSASISGGHVNPAVSFAFALFRPDKFPWSHFLPFVLAQFLGALVAGAFNLLWFKEAFDVYETAHQITRGQANSIITASCFGMYFPNPGFPLLHVSVVKALFVEAWGTAILMFAILALTDPRNKLLLAPKPAAPFLIGLTVTVLVSSYAPLTQMGLNPARDFGPRIIAAMAGWGKVAIPGPKGGFWIYIIGPMIGSPIGALIYDAVLARGLRAGRFLTERRKPIGEDEQAIGDGTDGDQQAEYDNDPLNELDLGDYQATANKGESQQQLLS